MIWMQEIHNEGRLKEWALQVETFLGTKWHSPIGSMPFHRNQKTLDFQGPTPSHLPKYSNGCCPHQKNYGRSRINHRRINS